MTLVLHLHGRCVGVLVDDVVVTHNMRLRYDPDRWFPVLREFVPDNLRGYLKAAERRSQEP